MLSGRDLKEYRSLRKLSLRDVARYCNVSAQMIGQVETGVCSLTESTYREIVKGINAASQAIARGTFEEDKAVEKAEKVEKKQEKKETTPIKKRSPKTNTK